VQRVEIRASRRPSPGTRHVDDREAQLLAHKLAVR
jgi:hypothetical protein